MKKLLLLLVFVLFATIGFADQCYVGSDCYIYHNVEVSPYDQLTINVTADNGTIAVPTTNMSQQSGDLYFINFNPEFGGNYTAFIQILNNSVVQANVTKEFTVRASGGLFTNLCPSTTSTTLTLWLFIAFFVVMAVVGFSLRQLFISLLGGLGIVFASLIVIGCHVAMGLLMLSIGLLLSISSLLIKT